MLSRNNQFKIAFGVWSVATLIVALHPTWINEVSLGGVAIGLVWLLCYHHAQAR